MEPAIEHAIDLVGTHKPGEDEDWKIRPTEFPALFAAEAKDLASLLSDSALTQTAESFEEADAVANAAQAEFQRGAGRATWCVFGVTVTGALRPAPRSGSPPKTAGRSRAGSAGQWSGA